MTVRTNTIPYTVASAGLGDTNNLDIDPANAPGGGPTTLGVTQIVHGGDCDVKYLVDTDGDGTYEVNVTVDSLSGAGVFLFEVAVELYEADNQILRVTNISGGTADFAINSRIRSGFKN